MAETANKQNLEQVLDADTGKEGLQLPKNFEDTFKKKENRDLLVKSVNTKFENSDAIKQNKEAIMGACKTEINSWGESLPSDAGKVAVLYLYNALNGKTLYKEDLSTAFTDFKKNKTEVTGNATEGKDAKMETPAKPAEILKDGVTDINEVVDGNKLYIKNTVESGKLKERVIDIGLKSGCDIHVKQEFNNGEISGENTSLKFKDESVFHYMMGRSLLYTTQITSFDIPNKTILTKNQDKYANYSIFREDPNGNNNINTNDIKNFIKRANILINNYLFDNKYTKNTDKTKDGTTAPSEITNTTTTGKETKPVISEPTLDKKTSTTTPTLKDKLLSIPALKTNEAINKLTNDIATLEKQQATLKTTFESQKTQRESSTKELGTKQENFKQLEEQIKDTKNIDDKFARKSAMDRLNGQKDDLQTEIRGLEKKTENIYKELEQNGLNINQVTTEISDTKNTLIAKLDPVQRAYEKNIRTINDNISKYQKALDGNYTESQKVTLAPDFKNWETKKQEQITLLKNTETNQNNLNTLIADLGKSDLSTENLADNTKPVVENKNLAKIGEVLEDGTNETTEKINGIQLTIKTTIEGGKLKERSFNVYGKNLSDMQSKEVYVDGKLTSTTNSLNKINDKILFDKIKLAKQNGLKIGINENNQSISLIDNNASDIDIRKNVAFISELTKEPNWNAIKNIETNTKNSAIGSEKWSKTFEDWKNKLGTSETPAA